MKKANNIKRFLSLFICLLMCLNIGFSTFAQAEDTEDMMQVRIGDFDPTTEYEDTSGLNLTFEDEQLRDSLREEFSNIEIIAVEDTEMGRVYHVDKDYHATRKKRSLWDIADFVMAGASWAEFFGQPSLSKFGWAALDTVALLPALPSSAYFRKGGKIFLKADEIKKFGKTADGYKAIKKALIIGDKAKDVRKIAKTKWVNNLRKYLYPRVNRMVDIAQSGKMKSKTIRFTQDSISKKFSTGEKVADVIKGLKNGSINPNNFPPIKIFELNGKWYSLDNRRLHVFKEAGLDIKYVVVGKYEVIKDAWKFTTKNNGYSIVVRNK